MNRKIMTGLSYGFYFIVMCLIFLVVYLMFFKPNNPVNKNDDSGPLDDDNKIISENIKLNSNLVNLDIGGSFELKVTLIPSNGNEKLKFSSENENVAKVDEFGKIIGVGEGNTVININVEGTNINSKCEVTVSSRKIVPNEIFVKEEYVYLKPSETYQIEATVIPINAVDKSITFSSSQTDIVTVDEKGLLIGIKKGTSVIEIKSVSNPEVKTIIRVNVK